MQANGTGDSQFTAGSFSRSNGATVSFNRSNASGSLNAEAGNLFFTNPSPLVGQRQRAIRAGDEFGHGESQQPGGLHDHAGPY